MFFWTVKSMEFVWISSQHKTTQIAHHDVKFSADYHHACTFHYALIKSASESTSSLWT